MREGKNREIRKVMEHLGLVVNRLIRISFGPFRLTGLESGSVREVPPRILADQLGTKPAEPEPPHRAPAGTGKRRQASLRGKRHADRRR